MFTPKRYMSMGMRRKHPPTPSHVAKSPGISAVISTSAQKTMFIFVNHLKYFSYV